MKIKLTLIFLFFVNTAFAGTFNFDSTIKCLNKLDRYLKRSKYQNKSLPTGLTYFKGNHNGEVGVYFLDRSKNYRFVSQKSVSTANDIYLPNNEYYRVSKVPNGMVVERIKSKSKDFSPIIAPQIKNGTGFITTLHDQIIEKSEMVLENLKSEYHQKKKNSNYDPNGLAEYSALRPCELNFIENGHEKEKLKMLMLIHKLPEYSGLDLERLLKENQKDSKAKKNSGTGAEVK